jgi:hypothetical protein
MAIRQIFVGKGLCLVGGGAILTCSPGCRSYIPVAMIPEKHDIAPRRRAHRGLLAGALACMAIAIGVAAPVEACVFDAECPLGSRCSRDPVTYKGECIDRLSGGQAGGDKVFDPFVSQGVRGRSCTFDVDCRALNARCLKRKGFLSGICIGN